MRAFRVSARFWHGVQNGASFFHAAIDTQSLPWVGSANLTEAGRPLDLVLSDDSGQTWRRRALSGLPPRSEAPRLVRAEFGWVVVYRERTPTGRAHLYAVSSTTAGDTWRRPIRMPGERSGTAAAPEPTEVIALGTSRPHQIHAVWRTAGPGTNESGPETWTSCGSEGLWRSPQLLTPSAPAEARFSAYVFPSGVTTISTEVRGGRARALRLAWANGFRPSAGGVPYDFGGPDLLFQFVVSDGGEGQVLGAITDVEGFRNLSVVATQVIEGFDGDPVPGDGGVDEDLPPSDLFLSDLDSPDLPSRDFGPGDAGAEDAGAKEGAGATPAAGELAPAEAECGCRTSRGGAGGQGWAALLALSALVASRRRIRGRRAACR